MRHSHLWLCLITEQMDPFNFTAILQYCHILLSCDSSDRCKKPEHNNYQLLILDEWLNDKVSERDAKIPYKLFEQKCGTNPTIFVGQYPVDEWHDRLGGGTQADSIMDRVVYNAYEIPTSETNLRKIYDTKMLKTRGYYRKVKI